MLIVQKYGGTSMGGCERIENVAQRVLHTLERHKCGLVVVVSAMSGQTDTLLEYAHFFSSLPNTREVDMLLSSGERVSSALLAIALESKGIKAIRIRTPKRVSSISIRRLSIAFYKRAMS